MECPATVKNLPAPQEDDDRLWVVAMGEGLFVQVPLPAAGVVTIGRHHDNLVQIDHPSVSRRHAALHVGRDLLLRVEDLGSANGTRVRQRALHAGRPEPVEAGDAIELGSALVVVQRWPAGERARARPTPVRGCDAEVVPPQSPATRELQRVLEQVARSPLSVLLLGETGVGKEVLAEAVHRLSPRAAAPFLRLNCAALSESLFESELFGHERGAFTGAAQRKPGLLETADGGTVFLDEVGELSAAMQVKLLRVLESRQVTRVGGLSPLAIDVRFVAATNRDLKAEAEEGRFRLDLFYRLNGIALRVPPLRERREEIEPLAREFAARAARTAALPSTPALPPETVAVLTAHDWPGNVRELKHAIERAVFLCDGAAITPAHLPLEDMPAGAYAAAPAGADAERDRILDALASCAGNQTRAARLLGISRRTIVKRLGIFNVPRPRS